MSAVTLIDGHRFLTVLHAAGWTLSRTDLRDAFHTLVGWPDAGALPNLTAEQRQDLLSGVCRALMAMEDRGVVPFSAFDPIIVRAGSAIVDLPGGKAAHFLDMLQKLVASGTHTYAGAARAALNGPIFYANLEQERAA